jgi:hypothetical protein
VVRRVSRQRKMQTTERCENAVAGKGKATKAAKGRMRERVDVFVFRERLVGGQMDGWGLGSRIGWDGNYGLCSSLTCPLLLVLFFLCLDGQKLGTTEARVKLVQKRNREKSRKDHESECGGGKGWRRVSEPLLVKCQAVSE